MMHIYTIQEEINGVISGPIYQVEACKVLLAIKKINKTGYRRKIYYVKVGLYRYRVIYQSSFKCAALVKTLKFRGKHD